MVLKPLCYVLTRFSSRVVHLKCCPMKWWPYPPWDCAFMLSHDAEVKPVYLTLEGNSVCSHNIVNILTLWKLSLVEGCIRYIT